MILCIETFLFLERYEPDDCFEIKYLPWSWWRTLNSNCLSAGYSEDSDYTSDLNYPVGGQGANSSASQFRTAANQLATPQRSLETSRENSYERDDHQVLLDRYFHCLCILITRNFVSRESNGKFRTPRRISNNIIYKFYLTVIDV